MSIDEAPAERGLKGVDGGGGRSPPYESEPTGRADLMGLWQSRGIEPRGLVPDSGGTIRPRVAAPPPLGPTQSDAIELGAILGIGGTCLVRVGRQPAMRREVAVKTLPPGETSPDAAAALLREAWVAARLEHPHIVPVYALHGGADAPTLVMRRIEGTTWAARLAAVERAPPSAEPDQRDALDPELAVFLDVCRAVEVAHARGVLHLDLKPSNVLVGPFGEVYLLDWGLAAALPRGAREGADRGAADEAGDAGPASGGSDSSPARSGPRRDTQPDVLDWLPPVSCLRSVCGTPAYMAPEQAAGDGAGMGMATDVYLLGATLHHVVAGRPPHTGSTVEATLSAAYESAPPMLGPEVPSELRAIVRRALARDPAARFPTVAALRGAIELFREHRGSARLTRRGEEALAALRAWSAAVAPGRGAVEVEGEARFAECRFAFRQSLATWPGNLEAEEGLQSATALMAERALATGDLTRALARVAQLPRSVPALAARCAALERELAREHERQRALERLGQDMDVGANWRARSGLALALGGGWVLVNLGVGALVRGGALAMTYELLIGAVAVHFALYLGAVFALRERLLTTAIDRRLVTMFGSGFVVVGAIYASAQRLGLPPLAGVALGAYTYLYFATATAVFFDARVWLAVALVAPVAVLASSAPALAFEASAWMGGAIGGVLAWLWTRPPSASAAGAGARSDGAGG